MVEDSMFLDVDIDEIQRQRNKQRSKLPEGERQAVIEQIASLEAKGKRLEGQRCDCNHKDYLYDLGIEKTCNYHKNEYAIRDLKEKLNVYDLDDDWEKRHFRDAVRIEYFQEIDRRNRSFWIRAIVVASLCVASVVWFVAYGS